MPKKTKKEKLLARYHKKIRLLESKQTTTPMTPSPTSMPIANQEIKILSINQYFFSDLKKSLILITLIIGLELLFYYAKLVK